MNRQRNPRRLNNSTNYWVNQLVATCTCHLRHLVPASIDLQAVSSLPVRRSMTPSFHSIRGVESVDALSLGFCPRLNNDIRPFAPALPRPSTLPDRALKLTQVHFLSLTLLHRQSGRPALAPKWNSSTTAAPKRTAPLAAQAFWPRLGSEASDIHIYFNAICASYPIYTFDSHHC